MSVTSEPGARPATRRYLAKKGRIVAAATRLLNETGVDGFTLARVADAVGDHPATLGYYWRKDTLVEACITDAAGRIRAMAEAAQGAPTAAQRVHGFLGAYFEERRRIWAGQAPDLADFAEIRQSGPVALEAYIAMFKAIAWLFKDTPSWRGRRAGAPWARLTIEQLGWSRIWLAPKSGRDFVRAAEALADFLTLGIAAEGQSWPDVSLLALAPPAADPRTASREAFLAAATETVNACGYRGASVDRISARLGRTKGAFYHHNADKDEVIEACFQRTFAIMREAHARAAEAGGSGWRRLAHAAAALAAGHNAKSARMLRTYALAGLPPSLRQRMVRGFLDACDGLAGFIEAGVADGSVRDMEPRPAAQMTLALINSSAYVGLWAPDVTRDNAVEAYVRPALMGLTRTA